MKRAIKKYIDDNYRYLMIVAMLLELIMLAYISWRA
jgi:hypothetical protein